MIKFAMISCAIAVGIGIACFACFIAGMSNAPQPQQQDEMDHLQVLCDSSRKEPWKAEIKTSCDYMQQFWAIKYKCEEIRGCYTEKISDGEVRY